MDSFDDPGITLVGMLFEAAAGAGERLEAAFTSDHMHTQVFEPLLRLARTEGGRLRMSDLAAQCHLNVSTLTRVADRLEALGFAERQACPEDRRAMYVAITETGRAALGEELPRHIDVIDHEVFGTLDARERKQLEALLRKVRDSVNPDATLGSGS